MGERELSPKKKEAGLPFRTQLFGGYRKIDVMEYIENLVTAAEAERGAIEEEKKQFYDLMKQGMAFCEKLTLDAQEKAEGLVAAARQSADILAAEARQNADATLDAAQKSAENLLQEANDQAQRLHEDYRQALALTQTDVAGLADALQHQQQEADACYARLLQPLNALLSTWGAEADAP